MAGVYVIGCAAAASARADAPPPLLIEVHVGGPAPEMDARSGLAAELAAVTNFPARASALDGVAVARLEEEADAILVHVSANELAETVARADEWLARASTAPETFLSLEETARTTFDVCLYRARAQLLDDDRDGAVRSVRDCRALVPHAEPHAARHPPDVLQIARRVDDALERDARSLSIPDHRDACALMVQGQSVVAREGRITNLAPGVYVVRERCPAPARPRVRHVTLPDAPGVTTELWLDGALHNVLSGPPLSLHFASQPSAVRFGPAHALEVARTLDVDEAWLVQRGEHGERRVRIGASVDVEGVAPDEGEEEASAAIEARPSPASRHPRAAPAVTLSLGAASQAAAVGMLVRGQGQLDEIADACPRGCTLDALTRLVAESRVRRTQAAARAAGVGGALLTASGAIWLTVAQRRTSRAGAALSVRPVRGGAAAEVHGRF